MDRKLGVAIALALGAAIAAARASGSPLTPGAHEKTDLWSVIFLAAAALAFVAYVAALALLRSARGSLCAACAFAVVIQALPLAGPLLLSRDTYSYWAYGRIVLAHGGNPYVEPPARFAHDPATRAVAWGWRNTTSVYGPAFTAASVAVAAIAGSSRAVATMSFRVLAAIGVLSAAALAAVLATRKAFMSHSSRGIRYLLSTSGAVDTTTPGWWADCSPRSCCCRAAASSQPGEPGSPPPQSRLPRSFCCRSRCSRRAGGCPSAPRSPSFSSVPSRRCGSGRAGSPA